MGFKSLTLNKQIKKVMMITYHCVFERDIVGVGFRTDSIYSARISDVTRGDKRAHWLSWSVERQVEK